MKKSTLAALALVCCGPLMTPAVPMMAQTSPTASTTVYNFDKFSPETILTLFNTALENGRTYPTDAEFEAVGILPSDVAFIRSHVRKAPILSRADRLVTKTYETRNLWCNLPMDIGSDGLAGYPDGDFGSDVFSMWQYTNLFGSWNHGFFQAPGAWVDAAHKNGTDILSGIKFFESWGTGDGTWTKFCTAKNPDGTYKYVKPLINAVMYFGADGINYNWEDNGYANADIVAFHKALYKEAAAQGFDNFHLGLYTGNSTLTTATSNALYGDKTGQTADLMLNYSAGDFSYGIGPSVTAAEAATGSADRLYTGVWISSMDRGWTRLDANAQAHKAGICLWGEHGQSRFLSYNKGADAMETQANYQRLLERGFSGGNRNPANRPKVSNNGNNWEQVGTKLPLSTFCGIAEFIPERSAIQGNLPFSTHFNLGNGDRYNYKGKKTGASWYNMANQDIVPTFRWLVYNSGTETVASDIQPEFTHADAYTGGSCLVLTGKSTATGNDIVLYKTQLKVSAANPVVKIALKSGKEGTMATDLSVIVRKQGTNAWVEVPVGNVEGATWQEKKLDLSALATGDVIDRIGLRVKGSNSNYKLYVGKLEISDDFKVAPATVKDLLAEVKAETKQTMSLKLNWKVNATATERAKWDLLYNDEANIDHFEVFYKNGANGHVTEVGRTTQWVAFINQIKFEGNDDDPYVGVRAVSKDLKTYSPVEWVHVSRAAQDQLPNYQADTYGVSRMDPACEGADIARKVRYVTDVTTSGAEQNIAYHANGPVEDGSQYANALDHTLKVKQGQEVELYIKCFNSTGISVDGKSDDGLRWCFAGGWMDLDGSGTFNPDDITKNPKEGERLFFLGKTRAGTPEFETAGIRHKFTVPADARTGQSRLRIVFSDAWFEGMFQPTGLHAKGFTIDFNVEIVGDNAQRPTPPDAHDQGVAEQPDGLNGSTEGISQTETGRPAISVEGGVVRFVNVDKAWIYATDGKLVRFVQNANASATGLFPGTYVVKMQSANVIRSQKLVVK